MHRVGLCMIVKNETHVIERCLRSIRAYIDHWTIVDTGSTDGTQDMVRDLLRDLPGFLLERPWRDFGHNRTEALEAARPHSEYTLVIDADEVFEVAPGFRWPDLTTDSVDLLHRTGSTVYWRASLVANRLPWRYVGVLHECLEAAGAQSAARIDGPQVVGHFDGGRSVGLTAAQKYSRDVATLEAALLDEPDNARYQYYLARSYRDCGQVDAAVTAYRRRAQMGGFAEEVWDSLLWIARLREPHAPADEVIGDYLRAWENRPTRAEPLANLARYCRLQGRFELGRAFARQAMRIPRPVADLLWVEEDVYEWIGLDEFAVSSYWTGHFQESADACRELLHERALPDTQLARVLENLDFALAKLPGTAAAARLPRPRTADNRGVSRPVDTSEALSDLLAPRRLTAVVDIGANPVDGDPPYAGMLRAGRCTVVGFEPNPEALARLTATAGPNETYLPWAVGDGQRHTLHVCAAEGMTSLLAPDPVALDRFHLFRGFGEVVATREVETRRLDELTQVPAVDLLKIDIQGSELSVFRSGRVALRDAVAIHTEVSFVTLYQGQPTFGEVDAELRAAGFVPHMFDELKRWPLTPIVIDGDPRRPVNQVLEADVVYVRDIARPGGFTDEQLKHLALIAHHCYGSFDLVAHCLRELCVRGSLGSDTLDAYCAQLSGAGIRVSVAAGR